MIDQKTIEDIRNKADIIETIGRYVPLKKRGRNYLGLCPFHNEKTPSFTVSPEKNIWRCFGCGKSGNVFSFIMEVEKLNFVQAVKALGETVGIEVKDEFQPEQAEQHVLYEINEQAKNFYTNRLKTSDHAQAYLHSRNLSPESVQAFELGYAPDSWESLLQHLHKQFKTDKIAAAGLVIQKENGNEYYDRFRDRLMFPIKDVRGRVIGFSGRVINAAQEKQAKYVNSPETVIYNKGSHLYGLNLARNKILEDGFVILVEGQLDVVACHSAGLNNVVASLGTAFTQNQARLLSRFTKNIILAYDQDEAGLQAADKAIEILLPLGFSIKILEIPAKDPDEMLQKYGVDKLKESVAAAKHFVLYKLQRIISRYDLKDRVQKAQAGRESMLVLNILQDPLLFNEYINYLSQKLQIGREVLQELKKDSIIPGLEKEAYLSRKYTPAPATKYQKAEEQLLRAMVGDITVRRQLLELFDLEDFSAEWQELLKYLSQTSANYDILLDELGRMEHSAEAPAEKTRIQGLKGKITELLLVNEHLSSFQLAECIRVLQEKNKEDEKKILRDQLLKAEEAGDEETAHKIIMNLHQIR